MLILASIQQRVATPQSSNVIKATIRIQAGALFSNKHLNSCLSIIINESNLFEAILQGWRLKVYIVETKSCPSNLITSTN